MPGSATTMLIEGTFEELAEEFAQYIDSLKKAQGDENSALQSEVAPLLQNGNKEETLKKLVTGSAVLNTAPEKELTAAYNLLIHLTLQAPNPSMFLPRICGNLSNPIPSSPVNGGGIALSVLSTIFNTLPSTTTARYHVFLTILRVIRSTGAFELLKPQLDSLSQWLDELEDIDEEDQRKLYLAISETAGAAGEEEQSYKYLLRALHSIPSDESSSEEARSLSLRALKSSLVHPTHFDFQDLTGLDSIQALRQSDPVYFQLLEIFNSDVLDDLNDFKDEHEGWIEKEGLDSAALNRKMRLLTLASLAASSSQSRSLPYSQISHALQISAEDVEMWVIDVIRAGLVEGKLSQLNQTFLVHRSTYRVFGENQWREVASRLAMWRNSLAGVLSVIRQEKQGFVVQREQETRDIEAKVNGLGGGGGQRRQQQQRQAEADID